jgi:flagellar basal-body rod modification protein FlgD
MAPVTNSHTTPPTGQGTSKPASGQVDKNMFMQLLVAQLRNQNPLNPTDSMAFVQQLAQFQQMEQSVNTGQDIAAIRQDVEKATAAIPATTDSNK